MFMHVLQVAQSVLAWSDAECDCSACKFKKEKKTRSLQKTVGVVDKHITALESFGMKAYIFLLIQLKYAISAG